MDAVVLVHRRYDVVHEAQHLTDHRLLVAGERAMHLGQTRVGVLLDADGDALARAGVL